MNYLLWLIVLLRCFDCLLAFIRCFCYLFYLCVVFVCLAFPICFGFVCICRLLLICGLDCDELFGYLFSGLGLFAYMFSWDCGVLGFAVCFVWFDCVAFM